MKFLQRMLSVTVLVLCVCAMVLPAAATTYAEHEGLEVVVEMDKEQYDVGEPITATITVTNTNSHSVTILNLEQLIPEGYMLAEGSEAAKENIVLEAGKTVTLQVTLVEESAGTEDTEESTGGFWNTLLYGKTLGIPNLLLAVILVIAFIVFMLLT